MREFMLIDEDNGIKARLTIDASEICDLKLMRQDLYDRSRLYRSYRGPHAGEVERYLALIDKILRAVT